MLKAERRWCVSGTIIQNSINDVYALLKFLRHKPWCARSFWREAVESVPDQSFVLERIRHLLQPILLRRTKETLDAHGYVTMWSDGYTNARKNKGTLSHSLFVSQFCILFVVCAMLQSTHSDLTTY